MDSRQRSTSLGDAEILSEEKQINVPAVNAMNPVVAAATAAT